MPTHFRPAQGSDTRMYSPDSDLAWLFGPIAAEAFDDLMAGDEPELAAILRDHPDYEKDLGDAAGAFLQFLEGARTIIGPGDEVPSLDAIARAIDFNAIPAYARHAVFARIGMLVTGVSFAAIRMVLEPADQARDPHRIGEAIASARKAAAYFSARAAAHAPTEATP